MMLVIMDIEPLAASIALTARIIFVPSDLDHAIVFNQYFQPAAN
jgi:hypothetical protein